MKLQMEIDPELIYGLIQDQKAIALKQEQNAHLIKLISLEVDSLNETASALCEMQSKKKSLDKKDFFFLLIFTIVALGILIYSLASN